MNYRKIWEKENGPIPVDGEGRTYEIHHIDGNKRNNSIQNLQCISIEEHFHIHYSQGDYEAANMIADRMGRDFRGWKHSSKVIEKISRSNTGKVKQKYKCQHCSKVIGGLSNLSKHEKSCKFNPDRVYTPNLAHSKRMEGRKRGPHKKETLVKMSEKKRGVPQPWVRERQVGKSKSQVTKDKIKLKLEGIKKEVVECPHCGKVGGGGAMIQWHFDNCKYKV